MPKMSNKIKNSINPKVLKAINNYAEILKAANISVDKLILFGSHAKGTANPSSDIDLCIVSPQFGKNRFEERVRLMKMTIGIKESIEPHPYNASGLKEKWDPLAEEIRKYGLVVD